MVLPISQKEWKLPQAQEGQSPWDVLGTLIPRAETHELWQQSPILMLVRVICNNPGERLWLPSMPKRLALNAKHAVVSLTSKLGPDLQTG